MPARLFKSRKWMLSLGILVFILLANSARAKAATLLDYQRRVWDAASAVERLRIEYHGEDRKQLDQRVESTIARVRADLPAKETVPMGGAGVAVDNTWLHDALDDYVKMKGDDARRAELLAHIDERLRALGERLKEKEIGTAANKDETKARLAEILRRPEYNKGAAEGSALERLWQKFVNWLAKLIRSLFPKTKALQPGSERALSRVALIIVVAVSLAIIAFVIWKFAPRFLSSRGKKKQKREARIVLGERLEPDQTSADLLAQAEALARSGDLRAAIRKAYIALLCELGDRKIISLAQHKTNRDYLNSVRGRASLYSSMRGLTNIFELHWYGFVPAGENDWQQFRNGYQQALMTESG